MANALTGDYDAVLQVAVRQINGLLATLHQNGAHERAALKLLHSSSIRVGDPAPQEPEVAEFHEWVRSFHQTQRQVRGPMVQGYLTQTAPPGVAKLMASAFDILTGPLVLDPTPDNVRGTVRLQVSTLNVSLPPTTGAGTPEVSIHARVRALYAPDEGAATLPGPVHGEVVITYEITRVPHGNGRRLVIRPSADDNKIHFTPAPGSGIDTVEASRLSVEIRKLVREGIKMLPVDLPSDFPFADFRGLGSGAQQLLALPMNLSGTGAPSGNIQSVATSFLGGSGFAFAVRKEFVQGKIDIPRIQEAIRSHTITVRLGRWGIYYNITYRLRFSSGPTLTFRNGTIEISGRVEAETSTWWAPNGFVSFKQALTLVLDAGSQSITLETAGEPEVDESWFIPHSRAVNVVKTEMAKALAANGGSVRSVFSEARTKLSRGLRTFDTGTTVRYAAVQITVDGIVVRGEIGGGARLAPVVEIGETNQREDFTALRSWIPGGTIDRMVWSWVEYPGLAPTVWDGVSRSATEVHRFVFPKPPGVTQASQICLRIEGTQMLPSGQLVSVAGGTTCLAPDPGTVMEVPSWWEPVTVPVWHADLAPDVVLREAIAGHVTVQSDRPRTGEVTHNTLVCFADEASDQWMTLLAEALGMMRRRSVSLVVVLVLPQGAFDLRRNELEKRLGLSGKELPQKVMVQFAEDVGGGWSRTFAVEKQMPCVHLINARREWIWKHEGFPPAGELADALDRLLVAAPGPRLAPLRLSVGHGGAVPDAEFRDVEQHEHALHRMRGRKSILCFWQSWSAPCLRELRRLQELVEELRKEETEAPFIAALHGGGDDKMLEHVRKELGLTFVLALDEGQRIARSYGVRCWPTTVMLDEQGLIEHVQFGTIKCGCGGDKGSEVKQTATV